MMYIKNDNFKVAISGQGIDEPMGGYKKYRAQNFINNVKRIPLSGEISKKISIIMCVGFLYTHVLKLQSI